MHVVGDCIHNTLCASCKICRLAEQCHENQPLHEYVKCKLEAI